MGKKSLLRKIIRWGFEEHSLLAWGTFGLAWQALSWVFPIPSAWKILSLVWSNLTNPGFQTALGESLLRMLIGYFGVIVFGIGLGVLIGRYRWLDNVLGTVGAALNAMPGAAWVPLAVFLFGLTQKAVIFTIVLGATGIVMVNTGSGMKHVDPLMMRAARTMGARGLKIFFYVIVPAAIPKILDGLRLAWAFGWRALMAGELLISSVHGMGQLLNDVAKKRDIEQLLAFMVIIGIIGAFVDAFVFNKLIQDRVRARWGTA